MGTSVQNDPLGGERGAKNKVYLSFSSSVDRALAMLAGDPGLIFAHATNFSNFSEGIGKPL